MKMETYNFASTLLANIPRFYAIKCFIGIFVKNAECRCKYIRILYIVALIWTCSIYVIFVSPALNIFSNVTALCILIAPYKLKKVKKVFAVCTIYVINALVDIAVTFFMTDPVVGKIGNPIYEYVVSLLFLLITIIIERTSGLEEKISLPVWNMLVLIFVPISSISCIYWLAVEIQESKQIVFPVAAVLLLINILVFYLYHSLLEFYSSKMKEQIFQQMIDVYAFQLDVARESDNRVKALRHDMKHHIIEIAALARQNKTQELITYLDEMKLFMLNPREQLCTGNKEIDGVLNYLLQKAKKTLNKVELKINIPEQLQMKQFYLCVILGNLVDNAVREAEKSEEKYLFIKMTVKQAVLFIEIKNSYSGKIIEKREKLYTTQKELSIHGIGLENVKKVVADQEGDIQISYTESCFCVHVLLYLPY